MDSEIKNLIKVWLLAITSLFYCYYVVAARFPRGIPRLMSLIPVLYLFTILPFDLTSFHLGAPTTFYLVWLGNFKLLLFAFNKGPLSTNPPLSFLHFTSIALLPIKTKNPLLTNQSCSKNIRQKRLLFTAKVGVFAIIIRAYEYRDQLHPYFVLALNCCHLYLGVELVLALNGFAIRSVLGLELEPQFDEPYLATSLQDFWGRRWNLMVTSILRPTIYDPMCGLVGRKFGRPMWAPVPAILATFLASGLMHEIMFFYLARVSPTWEVTWFFALHGACTAMEVVVKKVLGGRFRLHRAVSGGLTVGFVAVTGVWLFLPQMLRNGVERKAICEYGILVNFVRHNIVVLLACSIGLNV